MSKWIRNYNPTEIDGDDWDNILVLHENGQKSVHNWEDYVDDGMQEQGCAWMPLPQSDIPQSVSVTIEVGNKTYTVENNGVTIEVHDSDDPMGQPTTFQTDGDTITGILEAVGAILQLHLNGNEDCDCEDCGWVWDPYFQAITQVSADPSIDNFIHNHVNSLRGKTAFKPASKQAASKPWKNKIESYNVWKNKIGSYNVG